MPRTQWVAILVIGLILGICASQSLTDLAATLLFITALTVGLRVPPRIGDTRLREIPRFRFLAGLFVAWFAVVAAGLFVVAPPEAPRLNLLLEFRWMIELLLWISLFRRVSEPDDSRWIWLTAGAALSCAYGFYTLLIGYSPLHENEAVTRIGGFLNNPMPLAHAVGPLAVLVLGFFLQQNRPWRGDLWPTWLVGGLYLATTVLTFTRGVWVGVFVACLVLPLLSRRRGGWVLSLAALIACAAIGFGVPSVHDRVTQAFDPARSYDGERVILWTTNLEMFSDSPVIGLGYGENKRRLREYYDRDGVAAEQFEGHAHNQYLHLLAGTGALGLLCYLIFIGFFLRLAWQACRVVDEKLAGWALGLFGAQLAFHVAAITEANFAIAKNRYLLLFLMAATAVVHEHAQSKRRA